MKKLLVILSLMITLSSCATYHATFPKPDEKVNPYDQKPVPNDGAASLIKDIIN